MKTKHDRTKKPNSSKKQKTPRLARHNFTQEEDDRILEGVELYQHADGNPNWKRIAEYVNPKLHNRQVIQHYRRVLLDSRKDDFSEEQLIELYHYIREQNNWSEFSSMRSRYYDCHYSDKHLRTQSRKISNAIRRKYQCMSQEDLDALLAQEMEKRSKWPPVSQMPGADSKMHLRKKTFTKSKARSISASKEVFPISPKSTKDDSFINHYTRSATKRLRDIGFVEKNEPAQQPRKVVSRQIKKAKVEPSQIENNMELESSTTEILSADDIERAVQISNDVEKLFKMHEAGLYIDSNADYLIQLENIQACFDETPDLTLGTNDNSAEKPIFNFSYWL